MYKQASYDEPLLREIKSGTSYRFPSVESETAEIPKKLLRRELNLPSVAEYDVARHFTRLAEMNYSVDNGIYPLGSCTMKYNPKFADEIAANPLFRDVHPMRPESTIQGNLRIMYELQEYLREISDMDAVSLQPLAGAHGEFTGMRIVRKYFEDRGENRTEVIIPDSAHGTNPASATMAGFDVVEVPSNEKGMVDLDALDAAISDRTAALMITNPNTLGIFEENIVEIARKIHEAGGLLYYDGANLNAILGITSPGLMGFDIVHFNLHKTFATPHGGGGPGSGPVGVKKFLSGYLPSPVVRFDGRRYSLVDSGNESIGAMATHYGSFLVALRAWAYIRYMGSNGLRHASERAVLNTNYLEHLISGTYRPSHPAPKKHEMVVSATSAGKRASDIAKFILDNGMHPPTIYFPLIVHEALMIEVTESASKSDLDRYADVLLKAAKEDEESIKQRPSNTHRRRLDEVRAARQLVLRW